LIQVRFIYENHLIGEWADVADGLYLYPNPGHRGEIVAVQVRDDGNSPPPAHGAVQRSREKTREGWKYRPKAVPNAPAGM
jgi:hypothetical protein